jgi:predicted DsbA family dithiol-disulfide isomerase
MKVEVWSDLICPFCYIGKRRLESALAQLPQLDRVEICWKSFQLQPDTKTDPTRNALQHLAEGKGDAITEQLFKAYFTDGQNIADPVFLTELAVGVGLPGDDAKKVLASDGFADDVRRDIDDALQIGINGVPFFVFDNRYAVSGAQDTSVFLEALARTHHGLTGDSAAAADPAAGGEVCDLKGRSD